jgi:uncharacterized alkaline shock family protein YloU
MDQNIRPPGKTTISPDVLTTIARLTVVSVEGVSRMSTTASDVNHIFKRGLTAAEGVRVEVIDDAVYADIYVVIKCDYNAREVSHQIQSLVARSISEMVGMEVGKVNVHIEDIDYSADANES